jgi:glycosyltransferase involved in cell wall biosynthesis
VNPLVSVVTPFHNTAPYLAACIESVLSQSYPTFEYVLVDNQSTDGGGEIAERYAHKDARIRFFKTPTLLGQVPNYNNALRHVSPDAVYCKLVQADDWIFPDCLKEMVALAEAHPTVDVVSAFELRGKNVCGSGGLPFEQKVISGREACRMHMLGGVSLFGTPTTVMVRASAVRARDPFYDEGRYFEDTEVMYEVLRERDFGFVHQVLTFNRVREESIWGQFKPLDPLPLARLTMVSRYGRIYLTEEEFQAHYKVAHDAYFKMLARAWLRRPPANFFDFHRKGLADIGEELTQPKLARYAVSALVDEVLPTRLALTLGRLRQD